MSDQPEVEGVSEELPVYVISIAAELAGMHPQTLRQYDRLVDYYGGFEYVKEGEGRVTCGEYTFFTTESNRIQDCFDTLAEDMVDGE